jgi:hypothetical protein
MMQQTDMANERPNQFKIMLSDEEKMWLEAVAADRGLTASDVLRQHIREAHSTLQERKRLLNEQEDDFRWKGWHDAILRIVADEKDPIRREDIEGEFNQVALPDEHGMRDTGLALNQLTRNGYLSRLKAGYVITSKGRAALN